jgi:hypothetical protein
MAIAFYSSGHVISSEREEYLDPFASSDYTVKVW